MLDRCRSILAAALLFALLPLALLAQQPAPTPGLLSAAETAKILPATVFFRGLAAPIQARNSAGLRFPNGHLLLVTLVDTSGYSTSVQEKYQAYLITEDTVEIASHTLAPGAYGCGFIGNDQFIVQDLGAHDLFTGPSTKDPQLRRPTPLQLLAAPGAPGTYRLYAGRTFVPVHLAQGK